MDLWFLQHLKSQQRLQWKWYDTYIETYIKYIYIAFSGINSGYYGHILVGIDDNNCFVMKKLFLFSIATEKIVEYIIVFMVWNKRIWVFRWNKRILWLCMDLENVLVYGVFIKYMKNSLDLICLFVYVNRKYVCDQ